MNRKKNRLLAVLLLFVLSVTAISVSWLSYNAKAETVVTDLDVVRQNVLYKVVYANLERCYGNMKSPIGESSNNTWATYDSETYFAESALKDDFLKFPDLGGDLSVGKKNQSSCPKMITGWETNWFVDLFKKQGDYEGLLWINKDAEVPNQSYWNVPDVNKMGEFLMKIGYSQNLSEVAAVGDRKCFYFKADLHSDLLDYWGEYDEKITVDTFDYCVDLGNNDRFDPGEDIIVLIGNNDYYTQTYDEGHITDTTNSAGFGFTYDGRATASYMPKWLNHPVAPDDYYLVAIWSDMIYIKYFYECDGGYDCLEAKWVQPKYTVKGRKIKQDNWTTYCKDLGYETCGIKNNGGLFESDWVYSSLSQANESLTLSQLKDRMARIISNARIDGTTSYIFDNVTAHDYEPRKKTYVKSSSSDAYLNYFLKDVSDFNYGAFNQQERYILYWSYLKNHYKVGTRDDYTANGILVPWLQDDGTFAKKYIYDSDEDLNDKQIVLFNNKWDSTGSSKENWVWMANQLAEIDVATAFATEVVEPILHPDPPVDDPQDPGTPEAAQLTCYTRSGALGWILCPIIDQGADFVAGIYEEFIQPFLVLDSALFNPNETGGKATQEAWTQFQTFANLIFVVFFLFVIFSQLTGFGIDNYGIKKILPKLIIVAILINLSYFICQLAVDIANIIGYGVKTIFDGIGHLDLTKVTLAENPSGGLKNGFTATSILVVLVGLITVPVVLSQGAALLVPVFLAIIGIVIAVFTLFCILAIRKAMAVVLVVISPLAFVAYMLPNTKKLFDKWFSSFKAVLLAFPICAGMVYGGQAVARIIVLAAGSSNIASLMALSAAVMSVAPIFLIPSTLKKSMGAVASAVDRFSRGTTGRARGLFRNSNMAHDFQRRGQLTRAGVKLDKDGNVKYNLHGRLQNRLPHTKAGKQRIDAMRSDAVKAMGAASTAGTYLGTAGLKKLNTAYSAGQADIDKRRVADLEASYKRGDEGVDVTDVKEGGALQKALQAAIASGDGDRVRALSNIAASQGDKGRTAIKNAVKGAEATDMSGATEEQRNQFAAGKKALASNLMDKYAGAFKENARSTYDWAANNQSSGQGMTMDTAESGVKSESLRGSYMNSMDDDDFKIMRDRKESYDNIIKNGGTLDGDQQEDYDNIRNAAYAAQQDQSFTATKVQRQSEINALVGDYRPESVIKSEEEAAKASADSARGVADAIMKAQEQRDLDVHWESLSNNEKSKIFYSNPQKSGESNKDYMNRVVREYKEERAKQMRRDRGHFDD